MKRKRGGARHGAGRPRGSFSPWGRIAIAKRFYRKRFGENTREAMLRDGWLSIYDTMCELYKEDHPDDPHIHNKERFDNYCENMRKQVRRGRSEDQAMIEGHWAEWFKMRRRRNAD